VLGRRPCDNRPGGFGRGPSAKDDAVSRAGRPLFDDLEPRRTMPHSPGWCLAVKLTMRGSSGAITGIIRISRDVRAPIEACDMPAGFAAALDHFENDVTAPIAPSAPPRSARSMKGPSDRSRAGPSPRPAPPSSRAGLRLPPPQRLRSAFRAMTGMTSIRFRQG